MNIQRIREIEALNLSPAEALEYGLIKNSSWQIAEALNDGITVSLRSDQHIEIQFGKDVYVLRPETAIAIKNGIQHCLDHREFLNRTHTQVTHYDLSNN